MSLDDTENINRPHLAYAIIGGFTSLFMLVSLFVKEKLYIGEATVATICGIIFGPYGAGLFDPNSWGNVDQITLECSRIVLVVQCFAVGVELPKQYMTRHWRSVTMLLLPIMTFGWLICSLFIWWMVPKLSWLESLTVAACVTATDPVLASSVVGKGKFAKRIPRHLRDLLSAESGCNDGMAFPFIYMSLYLINYRPDAGKVFFHWFVYTVLYECVFGVILGVAIGYAGRHAIKFAERKSLIDRESFLVFYFVLALFCAGAGSLLGADDLLVGFCAGVAFSNDGWFAQRTEESHVSNVIDLLLNLAYFVYFGAIIPWSQYNNGAFGITPWRLVVIAIFVVFFRRIPAMVALKPFIPDIKTWREALFAGHFGPIGVGAIFVAILARAELETGHTTPLAELPPEGSDHYVLIQTIWPIVSFLVVTSIIVHGSSIAVFTLGKHVNTMRLTMSFTTGNDDATWLSRLPIIGSRTTSMSFRKADPQEFSNEKMENLVPPGHLPPVGGFPGMLSRASTRGRDESTRVSTEVPRRRRDGTGRPVNGNGLISPQAAAARNSAGLETIETYREGRNLIFEDERGEVVGQTTISPQGEDVGPLDTSAVAARLEASARSGRPGNRREDSTDSRTPGKKHKEAMAFRFDDNIIVEDADGEVIKRYKIPRAPTYKGEARGKPVRFGSGTVKSWLGFGKDKDEPAEDIGMITDEEADDDKLKGKRIRLRDPSGRKLSRQEFFDELKSMDPHARKAVHVTNANAEGSSSGVKRGTAQAAANLAAASSTEPKVPAPVEAENISSGSSSQVQSSTLGSTAAAAAAAGDETWAERKRREAALGLTGTDSDDSDDDDTPRVIGEHKSRKGPEIRFADLVHKGQVPARESASSTPLESGAAAGTGKTTNISFAEDSKGKQRESV
ncbi:sodium/hydrogen antiporter [Peziza echinospora]|nr:sodium/hydrogen antiporter [Peziza echinospora]